MVYSKLGIFIFRRDMRLDDNLGLLELEKYVDYIFPIFILDENQILLNNKNKNYFSNNAVQFICESLIDLNHQLNNYNSRLRLFFGNPIDIIEELIKYFNNKYQIIIGFNKDFSSYAELRDNNINNICKTYDVHIIIYENDYILTPYILNKNNTAYKHYSAYYKNALKHKINEPIKNNFKKYIKSNLKIKTKNNFSEFNIKNLYKFYKENINLAQHGGRKIAINKLKHIDTFKDYNILRDRLDYDTTNLSAYLNLGCISIREAYYHIKNNLGINNILLKQLYWRDFFLTAYIFLENAKKYNYMDERYIDIKWKNDINDWKLLFKGTGFLLIDAAIQELLISGFIHNRARLLLGTFWTKYLLIDTFHKKYGSQVGFSKYLVDAIGPSQNKMNHHWITEFDYAGKRYAPKNIPIAGRYMDISNKMIKKYDPECIYIKKWLPHLLNIPNKELINWNEDIAKKYNYIHPSPLFDHKLKYNEWINACK